MEMLDGEYEHCLVCKDLCGHLYTRRFLQWSTERQDPKMKAWRHNSSRYASGRVSLISSTRPDGYARIIPVPRMHAGVGLNASTVEVRRRELVVVVEASLPRCRL